MSRTVYLNGGYMAEESAKVSIFDRGFLLADAVYEVTSVLNGKLLDFDGHMERLKRSLGELDFRFEVNRDELLKVQLELVRLNEIDEGIVYLQITRGVCDRSFKFPDAGVQPTILMFTQHRTALNPADPETGIRVISTEDLRWGRRDIKTVQLLFPSMAKMQAVRAGADDAFLVQDGEVTEGTAYNAYIVTKNGTIVTRQLSTDILHGITRATMLRYAREAQMQVEERPFTIEEAKSAAEAFITSASNYVMPVVEIDGVKLGDGRPGPVSRRLRELYIEESLKTAI
ncbi:MAG: D-amino-acid transaminase [Rhodobacteraceae bacterium]|nr:D-amino-acid transaminase [Paracoccaceae bacterium]